MTLSILHRVTGVALVVGSVLLVIWLWAAAYAWPCFSNMNNFFAGSLGNVLLFGWSVAFYLHLSNGIRHLFWDMGKGFDIVHARRSAWVVVGMTAFFTLATWTTVLKGVK